MRSAAMHVVADSLRAVAVVVVAIIGLSTDENVTELDAWMAMIVSGLVSLGSCWALIRAVYSWYNLHRAVASQSHSPSEPHSVFT